MTAPNTTPALGGEGYNQSTFAVPDNFVAYLLSGELDNSSSMNQIYQQSYGKSVPIQNHISSLAGEGRWKEGRWWREFSRARFTFFSTIEISSHPSETERETLASLFVAWIRESNEWWGGTWATNELADWNVNQHLRGRKPDVEPAAATATENPAAGGSTATNASSHYWDPARDSMQ
ncbi:hypothetical protein DL98DRAFT_521483 [Cadophora sp. DSE1049]|nr:hypothetical protein DL98DRAFT_521483 [Cadophora sp. DSE1049]